MAVVQPLVVVDHTVPIVPAHLVFWIYTGQLGLPLFGHPPVRWVVQAHPDLNRRENEIDFTLGRIYPVRYSPQSPAFTAESRQFFQQMPGGRAVDVPVVGVRGVADFSDAISYVRVWPLFTNIGLVVDQEVQINRLFYVFNMTDAESLAHALFSMYRITPLLNGQLLYTSLRFRNVQDQTLVYRKLGTLTNDHTLQDVLIKTTALWERVDVNDQGEVVRLKMYGGVVMSSDGVWVVDEVSIIKVERERLAGDAVAVLPGSLAALGNQVFDRQAVARDPVLRRDLNPAWRWTTADPQAATVPDADLAAGILTPTLPGPFPPIDELPLPEVGIEEVVPSPEVMELEEDEEEEVELVDVSPSPEAMELEEVELVDVSPSPPRPRRRPRPEAPQPRERRRRVPERPRPVPPGKRRRQLDVLESRLVRLELDWRRVRQRLLRRGALVNGVLNLANLRTTDLQEITRISNALRLLQLTETRARQTREIRDLRDEIEVLFETTGRRRVIPRGGCLTAANNDRYLRDIWKRKRGLLFNPSARDNDCFFQIVWQHLGLAQPFLAFVTRWRAFIHHGSDEPISWQAASALLRRLNVSFMLWHVKETTPTSRTEHGDGIWIGKPKATFAHLHQSESLSADATLTRLHLLLHAGHWMRVLRPHILVDIEFCGNCQRWYKKRSRHSDTCRWCVFCHRSYNTRRPRTTYYHQSQHFHSISLLGGGKRIYDYGCRVITEQHRLTTRSHTWFADFEAFVPGHGNGDFQVYAAAICHDDPGSRYWNPQVFYGRSSLTWFFDFLIERVSAQCEYELEYVVFYNGSGFDNFFIVQEAQYRGIPVDFVRSNGRFLQVRIYNLVFWDLYLFLRCSLKEACRMFNVSQDLTKTDFDHNRVRSWDIIDDPEFSKEVHDYNAQDVVALREVHTRFKMKCLRAYALDPMMFLTLNSMLYAYWALHNLTDSVRTRIILPTLNQYHYFRRAVYGGRTMPQVPYFKDEDRGMIVLDIVSLYPTAMRRYQYPVGQPRWTMWGEEGCNETMLEVIVRRLRQEAPINQRCIYEVDVVPNQRLLSVFLMRRDEKTDDIVQSLKPITRQVYCGVELAHAVARLGYRVTKVYSMCEWPQYAPVFRQYVDHFIAEKQEAERGSIERSLAKLSLNGLFGKCLQRVFDTQWQLINRHEDLVDVYNTESVKNMVGVWHDQKILAAAVEVEKPCPRPSKPTHFGAMILANARVIMSEYLLENHGYTDPSRMYYYTDTDSLHLKLPLREELTPYMDNRLGCFTNDLGEGAFVIEACYLAPKTYCLRYRRENTIYQHVRCKGIPLNKDGNGCTWDDFDESRLASERLVAQSAEQLFADMGIPDDSVSSVIYERFDAEDGPRTYSNVLVFEDFYHAWKAGATVKAIYTTIEKHSFQRGDSRLVGVRRLTSTRTLCLENWWGTGKRQAVKGEVYTVPEGYIDYMV
jgi:hypothetical protein